MTDRSRELEALRKDLKAIDLSKLVAGPSISTGVLAFDLAMSGGFPEGRFTEIFGDWQSGKSLLCYQAIRECQLAGGIAILLDVERALEKRWVKTLGINLEELFLYFPVTLEEAFEIIEKAVKTVRAKGSLFKDCPVLLVYDSLAASLAKDELDRDFGAPEMALRARIISQSLRRMVGLIADCRVAFVMVNQMRDRIDVFLGAKDETTGGRAPKFYSSLRVEMRKRARIHDAAKNVIGVNGRFMVVKSKVGVPFRFVEFHMMFKRGIEKYDGLLFYLIQQGVMNPASGGWFSFGERRFRSKEFPEIYPEIEEQVKARLRGEGDDKVDEDKHQEESESSELVPPPGEKKGVVLATLKVKEVK